MYLVCNDGNLKLLTWHVVKVVVVVKNAVVRVVVVVVVKAKTRKKANRHSSNKDIKAGEGHMFMYLR